jgi:hypothetical protein
MPARKPDEYLDGQLSNRCYLCKTVKHLWEFNKDKTRSTGASSACKVCSLIKLNEWRNSFSPEDLKARRHVEYRKRQQLYPELKREKGWKEQGIKLKYEEYVKLLGNQGFKCRICKRSSVGLKKALAPDHDHRTGKIRGLLCTQCNTAIGHFQDSPDLLIEAANYLRENSCLEK